MSGFLDLTIFEFISHDKVTFFPLNISLFPPQVKYVCFSLILCQRETPKNFVISVTEVLDFLLFDRHEYTLTESSDLSFWSVYIYITSLWNFFFVLQDLIHRINSYFQRIAFQKNLLLIGFYYSIRHKLWPMEIGNLYLDEDAFKLVRSRYNEKLPVSIKPKNLHSFEEGEIFLCKSILVTRICYMAQLYFQSLW